MKYNHIKIYIIFIKLYYFNKYLKKCSLFLILVYLKNLMNYINFVFIVKIIFKYKLNKKWEIIVLFYYNKCKI